MLLFCTISRSGCGGDKADGDGACGDGEEVGEGEGEAERTNCGSGEADRLGEGTGTSSPSSSPPLSSFFSSSSLFSATSQEGRCISRSGDKEALREVASTSIMPFWGRGKERGRVEKDFKSSVYGTLSIDSLPHLVVGWLKPSADCAAAQVWTLVDYCAP